MIALQRPVTTVRAMMPPAAPRELAVHEPGRAAARQAGLATGRRRQAIAPGGKARLDGERGRFEVVGGMARAAQLVPGPVDGRRGAAEGRGEQREARPPGGQRLEQLADAPDPRPPPPRRQNGTSAPSASGQVRIEAIGPAQDGGGVGRAAAETGAERDPLADDDAGAAIDRPQRPDDEVVLAVVLEVVGRPAGPGRPAPSRPVSSTTSIPSPGSNVSSSARSSATISASMRW